MLPNPYPLLSADSAVTLLIGSPPRVFRHGDAPQKVALPYVTWSTVGSPENNLDGMPPVDQNTVTIDAWSNSDTEVETLGEAIRDAIEPTHHMISLSSGRDPDTMRYRVSLTFTFWTDR